MSWYRGICITGVNYVSQIVPRVPKTAAICSKWPLRVEAEARPACLQRVPDIEVEDQPFVLTRADEALRIDHHRVRP